MGHAGVSVSATASLRVLTRRQSNLTRNLIRQKHARVQEGAFVIEGAKFCHDLIEHHPQAIQSLILSPHYLHTEDTKAREARVALKISQFTCSDAEFERLSDVETSQGILAVVRQPQWDERSLLEQPRVLGLYGDRLRDPANVGTIIRTAAALNLSGVWLSGDSADPFSPKAVRAAAGTVMSLPVFPVADARVFMKYHCVVYAAVPPSPNVFPLRKIRTIPSRLVVALGNEGQGVAEQIMGIAALKFTIPLAREIESLNVAATAAIAAFYLADLPTGF